MKIVCVLLLLSLTVCYIELPIVRIPHNTKSVQLPANLSCPKDQLNTQFTEVCYLKDIAHAIQLYHNDELYLIAMDLTIPTSWIKSPHCKIAGDSHACNRIEKSVKEEITNKIRSVKNKIKEKFKKSESEPAENYTTIGSIDRISGELEKCQNVTFWTKDSDKLTSLYKLFLIGLFLTDEKDRMSLNATNFINATEISSHTNKLSDGAISLRFDQQSENSFLNEIFSFVGSPQKMLTFYLGSNSSVTIGDLSVKNSEQGYSGIDWVVLDDKKYPLIDQIAIETVDSEKVESFECSTEAVFTLSASYIALPQKQLDELIKHLGSVAKCQKGKYDFLDCNITNTKSWKKKKIIFELNQIKISFYLEELHRHTSNHLTTLHIRQSQTNFVIFGEPVFNKYFTVLDYHLNKIGIGPRRVTFEERVFQIVTLVRILTMVFVSGCMFIVCYKPVNNLIETFRLYNKLNDYSKGSETSKLKYSGLQDTNPYEDLNKKVQETLDQPMVQGI